MKKNNEQEQSVRLSRQAVTCIMMAVQKGMLEKTNIVDMLLGFKMLPSVDGLIVENPPVIDLSKTKDEVVKEAVEKKTRHIRRETLSMEEVELEKLH